MKKRGTWRLPKAFVPAEVESGGGVQRYDGEPVLHRLENHDNDRTLSTFTCIKCCDCGLSHLHTYNVMKAPDGKWWLLARAYRAPGTGKADSE